MKIFIKFRQHFGNIWLLLLLNFDGYKAYKNNTRKWQIFNMQHQHKWQYCSLPFNTIKSHQIHHWIWVHLTLKWQKCNRNLTKGTKLELEFDKSDKIDNLILPMPISTFSTSIFVAPYVPFHPPMRGTDSVTTSDIGMVCVLRICIPAVDTLEGWELNCPVASYDLFCRFLGGTKGLGFIFFGGICTVCCAWAFCWAVVLLSKYSTRFPCCWAFLLVVAGQ
jgi:hypothetical protein